MYLCRMNKRTHRKFMTSSACTTFTKEQNQIVFPDSVRTTLALETSLESLWQKTKNDQGLYKPEDMNKNT